jgi:hypothetical protein
MIVCILGPNEGYLIMGDTNALSIYYGDFRGKEMDTKSMRNHLQEGRQGRTKAPNRGEIQEHASEGRV